MISETKLLDGRLNAPDRPGDLYQSFGKFISDPDGIMRAVKESGLLGRSGSGFPAGVKWDMVRQADAAVKYVVCNAEEGEPDTGKDRILLTEDPHAVLEGILLAGICVGAQRGYIYLRGEYRDVSDVVSKAICDAKAKGLLGKNILNSGFDFEIELRHSANSYISGEETALLEALEGRRVEPRQKPPYPGVCGLFGKPTLISNVETFANIPLILRLGPDGYRKFGTPEYPGTKLITVTGCVSAPGVYEISVGATIAEILELAGGTAEGKDAFAVQTGGGSGPVVGMDRFGIPFDIVHCKKAGAFFGTGSLRFFDRSEDLLGFCEENLQFFSSESCGRCVPCRIGLSRAKQMLHDLRDSSDRRADSKRLWQFLTDIKRSVRCAMGVAAVTPTLSAMENFPHLFYSEEGGDEAT